MKKLSECTLGDLFDSFKKCHANCKECPFSGVTGCLGDWIPSKPEELECFNKRAGTNMTENTKVVDLINYLMENDITEKEESMWDKI